MKQQAIEYCGYCGSQVDKRGFCETCCQDVNIMYKLAQGGQLLTVEGYQLLVSHNILIESDVLKELCARARVQHGKEGHERKAIQGKPINQDDINNFLIDFNLKGC